MRGEIQKACPGKLIRRADFALFLIVEVAFAMDVWLALDQLESGDQAREAVC